MIMVSELNSQFRGSVFCSIMHEDLKKLLLIWLPLMKINLCEAYCRNPGFGLENNRGLPPERRHFWGAPYGDETMLVELLCQSDRSDYMCKSPDAALHSFTLIWVENQLTQSAITTDHEIQTPCKGYWTELISPVRLFTTSYIDPWALNATETYKPFWCDSPDDPIRVAQV